MHHVTHMNVPHGKHTCVVHVVPFKPKGTVCSGFSPYFVFILFWIVGVAWERGAWCAQTCVIHSHACIMSHIRMSHAVHMNTSHRTDACVMPPTWMRHVAHMHAPCCTHACATLHTWMRHFAHMHVYSMSHMCMRHARHILNSCHIGRVLVCVCT